MASKGILRLLDRLTVEYLKSQIETDDPSRIKKALQQLCKYYRDGFRVNQPELVGLEQTIVGLLYTQSRDEKVRRWALNPCKSATIGRSAVWSE